MVAYWIVRPAGAGYEPRLTDGSIPPGEFSPAGIGLLGLFRVDVQDVADDLV